MQGSDWHFFKRNHYIKEIKSYLGLWLIVHHHNDVDIVFFYETPEVRLCRRQRHLCDNELILALITLQNTEVRLSFNKTYCAYKKEIYVACWKHLPRDFVSSQDWTWCPQYLTLPCTFLKIYILLWVTRPDHRESL